MKLFYKLVTIAALSAPLTFAPLTFAQDTSGNSMLSGSYRFRYVAPINYNSAGAISEVVAADGVITFSGTGSYIIAQGSTFIDNTQNGGRPQEFPASASTSAAGSYGISAAGIGYISSPLAVLSSSFEVAEYGTLSDGIFVGSATESDGEIGSVVNDLFVVMLVGTPPTNSTFTSPYWIGSLDFSGGSDAQLKNALLEISPNGSGGLGTLSVTGQTYNQPGVSLSQTVTGATYSFASDGGATLTLPLPSGVSATDALFTGTGANTKLMYVSSDGHFVLGWNPNGYDIFFGVQALTVPGTDSLFKGLYYLGGLSDQPLVVKSNTIESGCGAESFWGSENADGVEDEIMHQRLLSQFCSNSGAVTDFGTDDYTAISSDGSASDALGNLYAFGDSGKAFVSISNSLGYLSLMIGIHAPSFCPGSGLCLNPTGVVNAASWDPVTAGFAPGELITLFGSGFSSSTLANIGGLPFGTSLGTTQVLVNEELAPIYYVSPTQISAIIPYGVNAATGYAEIQVNNGGLLTDPVQVFLTDANSGIFSQGQDGIGDAIAEHANGSIVSPNNPAQPGETIVLALTGMGAVTPLVQDGAVGPSSPLSYANNFTTANELLVLFNDYNNNVTGQQATVSYAGLYPGLAGLYQMNVQVPTNVGPGEVYIEVVTDAADVEQVTVCVTACSADAVSTAAKVQARRTLVAVPPRLLPRQKARPHTTRTTGLTRIAPPSLPSPARAPALPPSAPSPQN
jgi:uncharacterized protein (TIGR03437 family)